MLFVYTSYHRNTYTSWPGYTLESNQSKYCTIRVSPAVFPIGGYPQRVRHAYDQATIPFYPYHLGIYTLCLNELVCYVLEWGMLGRLTGRDFPNVSIVSHGTLHWWVSTKSYFARHKVLVYFHLYISPRTRAITRLSLCVYGLIWHGEKLVFEPGRLEGFCLSLDLLWISCLISCFLVDIGKYFHLPELIQKSPYICSDKEKWNWEKLPSLGRDYWTKHVVRYLLPAGQRLYYEHTTYCVLVWLRALLRQSQT